VSTLYNVSEASTPYGVAKILGGFLTMSVKLTNKKADAAPVVAEAKEEKVVAATTEKKEKAPVTSGVFLVSSPDGKYKAVCTSSRIEVCWKDYSKWNAEKKNPNKEMQAAFDACNGNLKMTILQVADKSEFKDLKKKYCKEQGIDMKVPFSKDVIKAKDIV